MPSNNTWDDILDVPFRWPTSGDSAFKESEYWQDDAEISKNEATRLVMMMSGYKKTGDLLVKHTEEITLERHYLVYQ